MKHCLIIISAMFSLPILLTSCKEGGLQYMDFHNASNKEIIVYDLLHYNSWNYPVEDNHLSEDNYERIKNNLWGVHILPGETVRVLDMIDAYVSMEGHLSGGNCWIFFVLDAEIVAQSTAEELTDGRAILDIIYYYYEDISLIGPVLTYPNDYGHLPD